jgi:hypothetical protein
MTRLTFSLMVTMVFGTTACAGPPVGTGGTGGAQTTTDTPMECSASVEEPCMRYHIPLDGNPSFDVALRNKYIAAFGSACYMSEVSTFDCFYQKWQAACADAVQIGGVSGNAPYDTGYMCQPVAGTEDYSLQIGADVGQTIFINYQAAPRQTSLTEVDGMPTEVSGPYRNLVDPPGVGPGGNFDLNSGIPDGDGGVFIQKAWVLQVNKNAHGGQAHSDLAGFKWTCPGEDGGPTTCIEPDILPDPEDPGATYPNVHHVVPKKDGRCCPWGTNSYKNAAVISSKLNEFFSNNDPPVEEVKRLNNAPAYTP